MADAPHEHYLHKARAALAELVAERRAPECHGVEHACSVLANVRGAFVAKESPLASDQVLAIELGALLHDADDAKLFGPTDPESGPAPNARSILERVLHNHPSAEAVRDLALEAIGLVSASANGDTVPPRAAEMPELLYPRHADRLMAVGVPGIVRCWRHNQEVGRPLYTEETPKPQTKEEALELATPERFAAYQAAGTSASMIDHYFDQLFHIVTPLLESGNEFFEKAARASLDPMVEICVAARPDELQERLDRTYAAYQERFGVSAPPTVLSVETLQSMLETVRKDLEAAPGRSVLHVSGGDDQGGCTLSLDTRQDLRKIVEGALDRAGSDGHERAFALGFVKLWETYDHEELVLCMIQLGEITQAVAVQKPWITDSHPHGADGVRLPDEGPPPTTP